jgi:putative transposase
MVRVYAERQGCEGVELNVHLKIDGVVKGKSAVQVFKQFPYLKKPYWGNHFWAKGSLR